MIMSALNAEGGRCRKLYDAIEGGLVKLIDKARMVGDDARTAFLTIDRLEITNTATPPIIHSDLRVLNERPELDRFVKVPEITVEFNDDGGFRIPDFDFVLQTLAKVLQKK